MPERSVEVLFEAGQYEKLEQIARTKRQSVAALVKQAVEDEYLQPDLAEKRQAVERLLELTLPVERWEDVKEDLLKQRSADIEAS